MNNFALVVEDDIDLAEIFVTALKGAGYEVEHVADGKLAQEKLTGEKVPHIILLDMHLPHISGGDLLTNIIKPDERYVNTTIIITAADARMGDMYQDQVDFVMIKPISFVQLRDLTSRLKPKA
jgi:chemosensory pili system protein ChpA (sensor histidine kinase/response regulator)